MNKKIIIIFLPFLVITTFVLINSLYTYLLVKEFDGEDMSFNFLDLFFNNFISSIYSIVILSIVALLVFVAINARDKESDRNREEEVKVKSNKEGIITSKSYFWIVFLAFLGIGIGALSEAMIQLAFAGSFLGLLIEILFSDILKIKIRSVIKFPIYIITSAIALFVLGQFMLGLGMAPAGSGYGLIVIYHLIGFTVAVLVPCLIRRSNISSNIVIILSVVFFFIAIFLSFLQNSYPGQRSIEDGCEVYTDECYCIGLTKNKLDPEDNLPTLDKECRGIEYCKKGEYYSDCANKEFYQFLNQRSDDINRVSEDNKQKVVDYLNKNKNNLLATQIELVGLLKKSGYADNDIQSGVNEVYGKEAVSLERLSDKDYSKRFYDVALIKDMSRIHIGYAKECKSKIKSGISEETICDDGYGMAWYKISSCGENKQDTSWVIGYKGNNWDYTLECSKYPECSGIGNVKCTKDGCTFSDKCST